MARMILPRPRLTLLPPLTICLFLGNRGVDLEPRYQTLSLANLSSHKGERWGAYPHLCVRVETIAGVMSELFLPVGRGVFAQ
jgi:hypothetical protein